MSDFKIYFSKKVFKKRLKMMAYTDILKLFTNTEFSIYWNGNDFLVIYKIVY